MADSSTYFFGGIRGNLWKVFKNVNLREILENLLENRILSLKFNFANLFFPVVFSGNFQSSSFSEYFTAQINSCVIQT